ncbi:hypothetical protein VTK73DRAFT_3080 [Phialemonium thermophilum]|uniref:WD repeat protein n=1 Tax=Phialemonium thermophilum TaxID=223376 RepID=A0ABR3X109_9PEZI
MYSNNINQARMRKLLGKPVVESYYHDPTSNGVTSFPMPGLSYRPNSPQDAVFAAGVPIRSIDASPDGRSAVLAGSHVLKTVRFDGLTISEGIDLRSLIVGKAASKSATGPSTSDQLAIRDVKWAAPQANRGSSTIFTACANGKIFQYDLLRASAGAIEEEGLDFVLTREDSRQINTLDINPHRGTVLLSGSQDGVARAFDIRAPVHTKAGLSFRCMHLYRCNADSVRHIKWSPKDGFLFACATDQGVVLKWDMRKHAAPLLKIKAHEKVCSSIAWHPDGDHLMSGGMDSKCHVWDVSKNADKKQKPKWTILTPAPPSVVVWRPSQPSGTVQGTTAAQVAVSYDDQKRYNINSVHIWDLTRPTLPYKEIQRFDSSPSALLWHDPDLLWTAGPDGLFNQCDVAFAPNVVDRKPVSTMSFSARGDVLMLLDERPQAPRLKPFFFHQDMRMAASLSSSPTTPVYSTSKSDSEDESTDQYGRRGEFPRRRLSTRSAQVLSTTPPGGSGVEKSTPSLEDAINMVGPFKLHQVMTIGHLPTAVDPEIYEYLSVNYLETLRRELPNVGDKTPMIDRVLAIMERYAAAAEIAGRFRLAQTWRILAYVMRLLLKRRAQYHLELRMRRLSRPREKNDHRVEILRPGFRGHDNALSHAGAAPRKVLSSSSLQKMGHHARSMLSEEMESTSNAPTPLARPVRDHEAGNGNRHSSLYTPGKKLIPILEPDDFSLPPSIQTPSVDGRERLNSVPFSTTSFDSDGTQASQAITEGYDFYDADALSKAVDVPYHRNDRNYPSGDFDVGESELPTTNRSTVFRHDSDDSFSQMFSVSGSSRRSTSFAGTSERSSLNRLGASGGFDHSDSSDSRVGDMPHDSHIRGHLATAPPPPSQSGPLHRTLDRTETDLTGFTDEHYMITQTTTDSFISRQDDDAPGEATAGVSSESNEDPGTRSRLVEEPLPEDVASPYIVETDYLWWPGDPPYPQPVEPSKKFSPNPYPPIDPYTLVARTLSFEARSSALTASAIVLLLKPLMPEDLIDPLQAESILRQQHSRLMKLKVFVEAALLRKLSIKGWPGGVLSNWGEDYPSLYRPAHEAVHTGFFCVSCHKPREIDRATGTVWRCENCSAIMAPCVVCGHRDTTPNVPLPPSEFRENDGSIPSDIGGDLDAETDQPVISTWWMCPGCGHGGHSTCLQDWHSPPSDAVLDLAQARASSYFDGGPGCLLEPADYDDFSGGCCPADGCGHACLAGRERLEIEVARTEALARAVLEASRIDIYKDLEPLEADSTSASPSSAAAGDGDGGWEWREGSSTGEGSLPTAAADPVLVYGDSDDEVVPSRAVDGAREILAPDGEEVAMASSPGHWGERMQRVDRTERTERERRKSVKFVAPEFLPPGDSP